MNWETIKQQVHDDDHGKWDLQVPASTLRFDASGLLQVSQNGNSGDYRMSEYALTQLCQRLAIPARYFKRLPREMQAELANYDLGRLDHNRFLLRGKGQNIRAVVSDRYIAYNNREVIEAVAGAVSCDSLRIKSFAIEERFMFIKLVSERVADEVLQLKAGVIISNSEVGWAQVAVEPFLYRKPCTNDLIVSEEVAFRHRHLHLQAEEFTQRIAASIATGLKLAEGAVTSVWTADQTTVDDPAGEIEQLGKQLKLSKPLVQAVQAAYQAEPRLTRWGVVNGFSRAAPATSPGRADSTGTVGRKASGGLINTKASSRELAFSSLSVHL